MNDQDSIPYTQIDLCTDSTLQTAFGFPAFSPGGYNLFVSEPEKITVRCPDCESRLVVDSATGEVLFHKPKKAPPGGDKNFEELLDQLDKDREQAEEIFQREVSALEDHDRLLEDKFKEAFEEAKKSPEDEPPPRPWDLD